MKTYNFFRVFLPIVVITFLVGVIRHYVSMLISSTKKVELTQLQDRWGHWSFSLCRIFFDSFSYTPAKQWFVPAYSVKTANIWLHNRSRCENISSTTSRADISKHRNDHLQHRTLQRCWLIWWRETLSMFCRWSSSEDGLIGCSQVSSLPRCHSHSPSDLSLCCREELSCNHLTLLGCRQLRGTSWMSLDYEIFIL